MIGEDLGLPGAGVRRPGFDAMIVGREISANAPGYPCPCISKRIPAKMTVPRGRLHLRVTQQFSDHREAFAECQSPAGIRRP